MSSWTINSKTQSKELQITAINGLENMGTQVAGVELF
jgi:hypothetical protein